MKSAHDGDGPSRQRSARSLWIVGFSVALLVAEVSAVLMWPTPSRSALRPLEPKPRAVPVVPDVPVRTVAAPAAQPRQAGVLPQAIPAAPARQVSVETIAAALSHCRSFDESTRRRVAATIDEESRRYGYDPMFVLAMIHVESTCRPKVRGPRGAVGLIQVKPSTAKIVADRLGLSWEGAHMLERPAVNLRLGLRYLWDLERRFRDPYLALAAYNLGPTRVARMERGRARQARYVRRVVARYEDILAEHGPYSS